MLIILFKKRVLLIFRQKCTLLISVFLMVLQASFISFCQAYKVNNMCLLFLHVLMSPKQHIRFVWVWTRCESIQYDMATMSQHTSMSVVAYATIIYLLLSYKANGYCYITMVETTTTRWGVACEFMCVCVYYVSDILLCGGYITKWVLFYLFSMYLCVYVLCKRNSIWMAKLLGVVYLYINGIDGFRFKNFTLTQSSSSLVTFR